MKKYWFKITDDLITDAKEITDVPEGFIAHANTFGPDTIYYKIQGTTVTEVIAEGMFEAKARERADDFISRLNVNVF